MSCQSPPRHANRNEVPIIDLDHEDEVRVVSQIRDACRNSAFFYVTNHDVAPELLEAAFQVGQRFFDQPLEEKMAVHKNKYHRGYQTLGTTRHPGAKPDLKESFDIGVDLPEDHPDVIAGVPMKGPNQWPDDVQFRETLEAYSAAITSSGMKVLRLLALSLDLEADFFTSRFADPTIQTRVIHYPKPEAEFADDFDIGAVSHTDYGLITMLAQDPGGGLEIQLPHGEWIAAPFVDGAYVVNLGDLMAHWTNDVYRSNPHRVVNRLSRGRMSIPTFLNPTYDTPVECIATCQDVENPSKYERVMAGEYVTNKIRANQGFIAPNAA